MLTTSMFSTERPARELLSAEVTEMFSVSEPAPPSSVSPAPIVVIAAPVVSLTAGALNVLSLPLPTNSSAPVVSELTPYPDNPLI